MSLAEIGHILSVWALPLVIAITVHEAAHGWMADRLGDDTARLLGRVTFNPIRHIDPFGTFVLPGMLLLASGGQILFGFAKPVPVAFHRLDRPKRDMIWVALAGPGVNIAMAFGTLLLMHPVGQLPDEPVALWVWLNMHNFVTANVMLAVFNMLPIPPLDGGRVLTGLLPGQLAVRYARFEPYGIVLLLLMVFVVPFAARELGHDFNPLAATLLPAMEGVQRFIGQLAGW